MRSPYSGFNSTKQSFAKQQEEQRQLQQKETGKKEKINNNKIKKKEGDGGRGGGPLPKPKVLTVNFCRLSSKRERSAAPCEILKLKKKKERNLHASQNEGFKRRFSVEYTLNADLACTLNGNGIKLLLGEKICLARAQFKKTRKRNETGWGGGGGGESAHIAFKKFGNEGLTQPASDSEGRKLSEASHHLTSHAAFSPPPEPKECIRGDKNGKTAKEPCRGALTQTGCAT